MLSGKRGIDAFGCADGKARTWSCVGDNGGVYGGVGNTPAGGPAGETEDMNRQMNCRWALEGKSKSLDRMKVKLNAQRFPGEFLVQAAGKLDRAYESACSRTKLSASHGQLPFLERRRVSHVQNALITFLGLRPKDVINSSRVTVRRMLPFPPYSHPHHF